MFFSPGIDNFRDTHGGWACVASLYEHAFLQSVVQRWHGAILRRSPGERELTARRRHSVAGALHDVRHPDLPALVDARYPGRTLVFPQNPAVPLPIRDHKSL
jgi:hypothetical protein